MATTFPERNLGSTASDAANKGQDKLGDAANKAKELGNTVSQKVGDAASYVGRKAEDAAKGMGAGMKSLGGTLREHAPHSGMAGTASSAVADSLENTGRYLQERGFEGICTDLTSVIRRNPIPALLMGIGAGFLLARATSRR
jgi:ABC-type transporter Mla subunit MlaD